ncbi:MAG: methyltransferase family protein [Promethearchaeota archaeon]
MKDGRATTGEKEKGELEKTRGNSRSTIDPEHTRQGSNDMDGGNPLRLKIREIAEDLGKQKSTISMRSLIKICLGKIHVQESRLLAEIYRMIKDGELKRLSVAFSIKKYLERLNVEIKDHVFKDLLLKNPNRNRVYQVIRENPGIIFSHLREKVGLGPNHLTQILNQLHNLEIISFVKVGKSRLFFTSGDGEKRAILTFFSKKENFRNVLAILDGGARMRQAEITRALGLHHKSVQYLLKVLVDTGIVQVDRTGGKSTYSLTPDLPAANEGVEETG